MADRRRQNGMGLGAVVGGLPPASGPAWVGTKALSLDGIDGYVDLGQVFAGTSSGDAFSVSLWMKVTSTLNNGFVLGQDSSGGMPLLQQYLDGLGAYNEKGYSLNYSVGLITAGTWFHVLVVSTSGSAYPDVYVNGSLIAVTNGGSSFTRPLVAWLLGRAATFYYTGRMCELAVWKGTALDSTQRSAVYNAGVRHDLRLIASPPSSYWPIVPADNPASGGSIADYRGSYIGTPYNMVSGDLVTDSP